MSQQQWKFQLCQSIDDRFLAANGQPSQDSSLLSQSASSAQPNSSVFTPHFCNAAFLLVSDKLEDGAKSVKTTVAVIESIMIAMDPTVSHSNDSLISTLNIKLLHLADMFHSSIPVAHIQEYLLDRSSYETILGPTFSNLLFTALHRYQQAAIRGEFGPLNYQLLVVLSVLLEILIKHIVCCGIASSEGECQVVSTLIRDLIINQYFIQFFVEDASSRCLLMPLIILGMIGLPNGLNIRNLVMHGFLLPGDPRENISQIPEVQQKLEQVISTFPMLLLATTDVLVSQMSERRIASLSEGGVAPISTSVKASLEDGPFIDALQVSFSLDGLFAALQISSFFPSAASPTFFLRQWESAVALSKGQEDAPCMCEDKALVLLTLFPLIEASFRYHYSLEATVESSLKGGNDGVTQNGDLVSVIEVAQDTMLYYTLEDLLSFHIVLAKNAPTKASVLSSTSINPAFQMRNPLISNALGVNLHSHWYNLFQASRGYCLRDSLVHCKRNFAKIPTSIISVFLSLLQQTAAHFDPLKRSDSAPGIQNCIPRYLPTHLVLAQLTNCLQQVRSLGKLLNETSFELKDERRNICPTDWFQNCPDVKDCALEFEGCKGVALISSTSEQHQSKPSKKNIQTLTQLNVETGGTLKKYFDHVPCFAAVLEATNNIDAFKILSCVQHGASSIQKAQRHLMYPSFSTSSHSSVSIYEDCPYDEIESHCDLVLRSLHAMEKCMMVFQQDWGNLWQRISSRTARTNHRRSFGQLLLILPSLTSLWQGLLMDLYYRLCEGLVTSNPSSCSASARRMVIEQFFPFTQHLVSMCIDEVSSPQGNKKSLALLAPAILAFLQKHIPFS